MTARDLCVVHRGDILAVQRVTRDFACELGFASLAANELVIVASELATNILKYGIRGRVCLEAITEPLRGRGVRITAFDEGPPFRNFELALRDGFSDDGPLDPAWMVGRGGIGAGLGAVQRLSDDLEWQPIEGGKWVSASRYLGTRKGRMSH